MTDRNRMKCKINSKSYGKGLGIKVSDITYVLATHYHPDHIGLVSELMRDRSNPDDIITLSEA